MKFIKHAVAVTVLLGAVNTANAGLCAKGYIKHVAEGGWNTNDLMINLEYSGGTTPPTWWPAHFGINQGYMRFRSSIDPTRLASIRTMAYLAMANGNEVEVRTVAVDASGNSDCTKADELKVFRTTGS